MSEIVAAYAVPHTPSFVAEVRANGARSRTAASFAAIKAHLDRARPDVIVTLNNDHFNTFFLDNWPTFAIGVAERTGGPSDRTPDMPDYELRVAQGLARHLLARLVADGFDLSASQDFRIDHGILVPLHFLTPGMDLPIVPVFLNCLVPPLPAAGRCRGLGRALAAALRSWPGPEQRVAVVASGSLSLEIGGPRAEPGKTYGVPDPGWAAWVLERIRLREHDALVAAASEARMLEAGNVAGELLSWIAVLGIVGARAPDILIDQPELGNAFAAWTVEARA
jgi:aromatic ring-opening dioxygenase catalytic subunit (LigB family)